MFNRVDCNNNDISQVDEMKNQSVVLYLKCSLRQSFSYVESIWIGCNWMIQSAIVLSSASTNKLSLPSINLKCCLNEGNDLDCNLDFSIFKYEFNINEFYRLDPF